MKEIPPQLLADVTLYPTAEGGRTGPTFPEWFGCSCKVLREVTQVWDCRILLNGTPMVPGETRRVGMIFLSPEYALAILGLAGTFFLWEGRIIGEARIV